VATQAERTEATRQALISAALELFGSRGYADVSVDELAAHAEVTTGALYHQFGNKSALFRAVYTQLVETVARDIGDANVDDGGSDLIAGFETYLDACVDPVFQRITLRDGPAVLGWDTVRDDAFVVVLARLQAARDAGQITDQPLDALARMIVGALKEAGFMIAAAENPTVARAAAGVALHNLIGGLASTYRALRQIPRSPWVADG
jgi:AcrR family transcriptional regulator